VNLDRGKESAAAFIRAQFPREMYSRVWGGRVVAQGGSNAFDFQPDDPRIPGHSGIPLKLPFPGFSLTVDPSQSPRAMLGWDGGDPSKPELRLWEAPGLAQWTAQASQSASLVAPVVNLGASASQQLVLGNQFAAAVATLVTAWETFQVAIETFCTALTAYELAIEGIADPTHAATPAANAANVALSAASVTMSGAVGAFGAAVNAALSIVSKTA
jgi:hypothetical protein